MTKNGGYSRNYIYYFGKKVVFNIYPYLGILNICSILQVHNIYPKNGGCEWVLELKQLAINPFN
jgi:hypothetical protein